MASSGEDEPDYMSEEFLASCVKDVRPGLVYKQSTKRQFQLEEQHKSANEKIRKLHKPARVLEAERREEGLSTAIATTSNKGFAMLQKMGFKAGQGLGKTGEGRTEPVPLEIKVDRGGLGREAAVREVAERKLDILKRRMMADRNIDVGEFRSRKKDEAIQRLVMADLNKSRRMCQVLDEQNNVAEPAEKWFWPDKPKEPAEEGKAEEEEGPDEEEEDKLEPVEKLELLTSYLRSFHSYCIWCGTKYEDQEDLNSNCPGPTRDDH